jgi:hypothetical protein
MRKKVRGLRNIEKQILKDRRQAQAEAAAASSASADRPTSAATAPEAASRPDVGGDTIVAANPAAAEPDGAPTEEVGQVVLDYCSAVRGILNDDQGGPLHPPGVRMAEALQEVSESLQRNLEAKKGGAARSSCSNSRAASTEECKRLPRSNRRSKSTSRK